VGGEPHAWKTDIVDLPHRASPAQTSWIQLPARRHPPHFAGRPPTAPGSTAFNGMRFTRLRFCAPRPRPFFGTPSNPELPPQRRGGPPRGRPACAPTGGTRTMIKYPVQTFEDSAELLAKALGQHDLAGISQALAPLNATEILEQLERL